MPHLHKKTKNGRAYYYLREIQRVNGKPSVVKQVYLGTPENIGKLIDSNPQRLQVEEFGALWLAHQLLNELNLIEIIDNNLPRKKRIAGLSVGEYFYYAVLNRLVEPCSKAALEEWYLSTAIQSIRPARIKSLTSANYWKAWDKVSTTALEKISTDFFKQLSALEPSHGECFIFDTTNYFTFIAPENKNSTLAQYGKSKQGRDDLRQVNLALVVARDSGLPLFYQEFPGNMHDSKVFSNCMHRLTNLLADTQRDSTVFVFDKGIIARENIAFIDSQKKLNFITSYVPTNLSHLLSIPLDKFSPIPSSQYLAYRTSHKLWHKERAVVVVYNPNTAEKNHRIFQESLHQIDLFLENAAAKVSALEPNWRDKNVILKRISDTFAHHKIPMNLFAFYFEGNKSTLKLRYNIVDQDKDNFVQRFGKQIIVSDLEHWDTNSLVSAYNARSEIEFAFRQSKDRHLVSTQPFFHWTDSKVRCHLLCCFLALCATKLLELKLSATKNSLSASAAMSQMKSLHAITSYKKTKNLLIKNIEQPNTVQSKILRSFDTSWTNGVLQKITA